MALSDSNFSVWFQFGYALFGTWNEVLESLESRHPTLTH